jgi:23S rRNA pseudouridine2605 synthase
VPPELRSADRGDRIQKVLAEAGVASRRECESMVRRGLVAVNGKPVTALPAWVDPESDHIEVEGRALRRRRPGNEAKIVVALHKPRRVICTSRDPEGRKRAVDLVNLPHRLFCVGRLDADSTGLILLTNDGELANHLTHPRYEVPKWYQVSIRGRLTIEDVQRLREGLYLATRGDAGKAPAAKASVSRVRLLAAGTDQKGAAHSRLEIMLHEGRNRQLRRLLARLGCKVRRLERIAIGPIRLKGLSVGGWRKLTGSEIGKLHEAAGLPRPQPARGRGARS